MSILQESFVQIVLPINEGKSRHSITIQYNLEHGTVTSIVIQKSINTIDI